MRLPFEQAGGRITLRLFGELDAPWVAAVVDDAESALGRPWRVLLERWEALPPRAQPARAAAIIAALRRTLGGRSPGALRASRVRARVLGSPVFDDAGRGARLHAAAIALRANISEIEATLWSDLPAERLVTMPHGRPSEGALYAEANLAMIQRALARAYEVRLRLWGNPRPVVRIAALAGLIHTARREGGITTVDLSGPLSIFQRTTVYGRALGMIVPWLAWCSRFAIDARCDLGRGDAELHLSSPIILPPPRAPRRYDSTLETRFARDLARASTDWRVTREPEVVPSGTHLLFPDFVLEHRHEVERRWWVELVGFWTADYLVAKLARYADAGLANLILCVRADRKIADGQVPPGAHVVRYERHVPVDAVLSIVDASREAC